MNTQNDLVSSRDGARWMSCYVGWSTQTGLPYWQFSVNLGRIIYVAKSWKCLELSQIEKFKIEFTILWIIFPYQIVQAINAPESLSIKFVNTPKSCPDHLLIMKQIRALVWFILYSQSPNIKTDCVTLTKSFGNLWVSIIINVSRNKLHTMLRLYRKGRRRSGKLKKAQVFYTHNWILFFELKQSSWHSLSSVVLIYFFC